MLDGYTSLSPGLVCVAEGWHLPREWGRLDEYFELVAWQGPFPPHIAAFFRTPSHGR